MFSLKGFSYSISIESKKLVAHFISQTGTDTAIYSVSMLKKLICVSILAHFHFNYKNDISCSFLPAIPVSREITISKKSNTPVHVSVWIKLCSFIYHSAHILYHFSKVLDCPMVPPNHTSGELPANIV